MTQGETLALTGSHAATVAVGGNLAAGAYTGKLTVTASGTAPHAITTGTGADSITAAHGADTVTAGAAADTINVRSARHGSHEGIAMPTIEAHDPGSICWIDLASTDAAGATQFYCDLFGWTATEPIEDAGGYRMLLHDGRQVAGLAPVWGDTDGSSWSTYVASADADQTCAAAVAGGGDVVMDAMDVLTAGRMAILRDPAGAQVSVWQAGDHRGYEVHGEPGTPIWSELMTRDLPAAAAFYRAVFGWTALEEDFDGVRYTVWKRHGQPRRRRGRDRPQLARASRTPLDGLHRHGRLRRHRAALRCARRQGLARAGRRRARPLRAAGGSRRGAFSVMQLRAPV